MTNIECTKLSVSLRCQNSRTSTFRPRDEAEFFDKIDYNEVGTFRVAVSFFLSSSSIVVPPYRLILRNITADSVTMASFEEAEKQYDEQNLLCDYDSSSDPIIQHSPTIIKRPMKTNTIFLIGLAVYSILLTAACFWSLLSEQAKADLHEEPYSMALILHLNCVLMIA